MMYAGYPELTTARRIDLLPPLQSTRCCVSLERAAGSAGLHPRLRHAVIEMLAERPVYRLEDDSGTSGVVYADDGSAPPLASRSLAARIAARATGAAVDSAAGELLDEPDQWLLEVSRPEFPVARFALHDSAASIAYVSLRDGELIQLVTRRERVLAWIGAIPHWIYPASLRRHRDGWRYLVLTLAACGMIGCLTGLTMGIWRLRRRGSAVRSPFVDRWMRWHHYFGLTFGLFAFSWVFSGLLSLNPFAWSPGNNPSTGDADRLAGGAIDAKALPNPPMNASARPWNEDAIRRVELVRLGGKSYYLVEGVGARRQLFALDAAGSTPRAPFGREELVAAFRAVAPDGSVRDVAELSSYDDYYYSRDGQLPLPVMRVAVDDAPGTRYYLDAGSGAIVFKSTRRSRIERWLYHGLHSWDFATLLRHPPAWDVVMIVLSLGGFALSVTGGVAAVRWLSRP